MISKSVTAEARIKTFVINLRHRTDRRNHILHEFRQKPEFDVSIIDAIEHPIGAKGLWQTIHHIIKQHAMYEEYILLCEDDHHFTENYDKDQFFHVIREAAKHDADVLSGGVSWLNSAVEVSDNMYWTEKFTGLQFVVIFKRFYTQILDADFHDSDKADYKICSLAANKYFIYPFISIQKEFGYSDVTPNNSITGRVNELFQKSEQNVSVLKNILEFYTTGNDHKDAEEHIDSGYCITAYVVNEGTNDCETYIHANFSDKPEFLPVIWETGKSHESGSWQSPAVLKSILTHAAANDEDAIIICSVHHRFSPAYSYRYLMKNIMDSHEQGIDILFGGANDMGFSVPVSENRCWISVVKESNFVVVLKSGISKLLNFPEEQISEGRGILSEFSSNKMILCPFVSMSDADVEQRLLDIRRRHEQHNTANGIKQSP